MSAQHFDLVFNGYWREPNKAGIPAESGVFCVYVCTFNPTQKTVSMSLLVHIGHGDNVADEVAKVELWGPWLRHKSSPDQELCFSFASVPPDCRERVAAALIMKHQPVENQKYREEFPFEDTSLSLQGRAVILTPEFIVHKTT